MRLPKKFRLIDVQDRCLVETRKERFVALSYVWGTGLEASLLVNTSDTVTNMLTKGGLPALYVPKTIEDAMIACTHLGERYLWADRLCIIQNDDKD